MLRNVLLASGSMILAPGALQIGLLLLLLFIIIIMFLPTRRSRKSA